MEYGGDFYPITDTTLIKNYILKQDGIYINVTTAGVNKPLYFSLSRITN